MGIIVSTKGAELVLTESEKRLVARSRASMLRRARSVLHKTRLGLSHVTPRVSADSIKRIENELTESHDGTLEDLEKAIKRLLKNDIQYGFLRLPPYAIIVMVSELAKILSGQTRLYGSAYCGAVDQILDTCSRLTDEMKESRFQLPAGPALNWLCDLYKSAETIQCIALPEFLRVTADDWRLITAAHGPTVKGSALSNCNVQRVYVSEPRVPSSLLTKFMDMDDSSERRILDLKCTGVPSCPAIIRDLLPDPAFWYRDMLDFAVVDDCAVGVSRFEPGGIGSVFFFGRQDVTSAFKLWFREIWRS